MMGTRKTNSGPKASPAAGFHTIGCRLRVKGRTRNVVQTCPAPLIFALRQRIGSGGALRFSSRSEYGKITR
jgi:hypothetical protein